jgi:uncharacterized protein (TIGR04255 family)
VSSPIKFEDPPVQEVAFSASFQTPKMMSGAFIGTFWSQVRERFPDLSENSPIPALIEAPSQGTEVNVAPQLQILNMPSLRRSILRSTDGRHIIQIQQDKFVLNWTRGKSKAYPDFETAFSEFASNLELLSKNLKAEGFGQPIYNQYELQYVNLVGPDNGLAIVGEGGLLVDHTRRSTTDRFLPNPSGFNWTSSYQLPNEMGRLHMIAQAVLVPPKNQRHVRLDVVARGFRPDSDDFNMEQWFKIAHEWIVSGFTDSTSPILQTQAWKRL